MPCQQSTVSVFWVQSAGGRCRATVSLRELVVGAVHGAEIRPDKSMGTINEKQS